MSDARSTTLRTFRSAELGLKVCLGSLLESWAKTRPKIRVQLVSHVQAIVKWESGTITAPALIEEKARLRLGRARARVVFNDLLSGTRPDKAAGIRLWVKTTGTILGLVHHPFFVLKWGLGCSLGVRDFDPWP